MNGAGKIVYEFEHAETIEALQAKTAVRTGRGWLASGNPRQIAVQMADATIAIRYCQTFCRQSEESISREPWIREQAGAQRNTER